MQVYVHLLATARWRVPAGWSQPSPVDSTRGDFPGLVSWLTRMDYALHVRK
jgi:hypothetical protein